MSQRLDTYDLDRGRCVGCRKRLRRKGSTWEWQAHHVLKQQSLRRLGVPAARLRDATFTVLLCRACHERHESRFAAIPFDRLPARVVAAVDATGAPAYDLLRRYHPAA